MRRYKEVEHENHERWVVSYADFITLLFAFFVVMYSISSVNQGKYKVLSETLEGVFKETKVPMSRISLGTEAGKGKNLSDREVPLPMSGDYPYEQTQTNNSNYQEELIKEREDFNQLAEKITETFDNLIDEDQVSVKSDDLWIEVEIKSNFLFASGQAKPNPKTIPIINELAMMLKNRENPIHVEGFTDNVPIATDAFPSNWELSAARAAAIVRVLMEGGVDPERLAAVGYGEHQPIADNATEEGRSKNRRVVLVISRVLGSKNSRPTEKEQTNKRDKATPIEQAGDFLKPVTNKDRFEMELVDPMTGQPVSPVEQAIQEAQVEGELQRKRVELQSRLKPVKLKSGDLLFTADPEKELQQRGLEVSE